MSVTIRRKFTVGSLGHGRYLVHGNHGDKFIVQRYEEDGRQWWEVADAYSWTEFDRTYWEADRCVAEFFATKRDAVQAAIDIDFARHNPEHGPTRADYEAIVGPPVRPELPMRARRRLVAS